MASFVLALPIGYYPDNPDSSSAGAVVGVYGGYGQVASVMRGCDGDPREWTKTTYQDVGASIEIPLSPKTKSPLVLGLRGGRWHSPNPNSVSSLADQHGMKDYYTYLNPNISVEEESYGMGIGYVFGTIPLHYDYLERGSYDLENDILTVNDGIDVSFHLRIGNPHETFFMVSFAENVPLASGGGYYEMGVGGRLGKSVDIFSGMSAGFYDRAGFVQHVRFAGSNRVALDLTIRLGEAAEQFEGSIAGGLRYTFGR